MKALLSILLTLITSTNFYAQDKSDQNKFINTSQEGIGFACSYGGERSAPVQDMQVLFTNKDYDGIRCAIYSKLPAKQFLAVMLLEEMSVRKSIELNEAERIRMFEIKKSTQNVLVCSGCMYRDEVALNVLFDQQNKHSIYKEAEFWVRVSLFRDFSSLEDLDLFDK